MALISCRECGKQVSTEAAACPACGAPPTKVPKPLMPPMPARAEGATAGRVLKWVGGGFAAFVALVLYFGSKPVDPKVAEREKEECLRALTSSVGRSTVGYADRQAYDKEVKDKCDGFEINGKPVVPR